MAPNFKIGKRAYGDAHMRFLGRARHLIDVTRSEMSALAALSAEVRRLTERFLRSNSHRQLPSALHTTATATDAGSRRPQRDNPSTESARASVTLRERRSVSPGGQEPPSSSGVSSSQPEVPRLSATYRPVSKLLRSRAAMADVPRSLGRSGAYPRQLLYPGRLQAPSGRGKFSSHLRPHPADPTAKSSPRFTANRSTNPASSQPRPPTRNKSRGVGNASRSRSRNCGDGDAAEADHGSLRPDYVHGGVPLPLLRKIPLGSPREEKPIVIPGAEALSPRANVLPPQERDPGRLAPLSNSQQADFLDLEEWSRFNRLRHLHLPSSRQEPEGEGEEIILQVPQRRNAKYRSPQRKEPKEKSCKLPSILNIQMSTIQPSSQFHRFSLGPDDIFARDVAERARARTRVAFVRYEEVPRTASMLSRVQSRVNQAPRVSNVVLPQFFDKNPTNTEDFGRLGINEATNPPRELPDTELVGDPARGDMDLLNDSYDVQVGDTFIASVGLPRSRGVHDSDAEAGGTESASSARNPHRDEDLRTPRPIDMRALRLGLNTSLAEQEQGQSNKRLDTDRTKDSKTQRTNKSERGQTVQNTASPRGVKNGEPHSVAGKHRRSTVHSTFSRPKGINYELLGDRPTDEDLVRLAELLYEYDMEENSVECAPQVETDKPSALAAARHAAPANMEAANSTWPAGGGQPRLPLIKVESTPSRRSRRVPESSSQKPPLLLPLLDASLGGKGQQRPRGSLQLPAVSATPVFPEIRERGRGRQLDGVSPLLQTYPFTPGTSARARTEALKRTELQNPGSKH